jgi:hypothetical protein
MKKRPTSAVGYKRPISQYARVAMAMGSHPRYRVRSWEAETRKGEKPKEKGCLQHVLPLGVGVGLVYSDAKFCAPR